MDAYREGEPWPELRPWVRCVWTFESHGADQRLQRIAPDGCPELLIHLGSPYAEAGGPQPRLVFAGQLTRPLAIRPTGPVRVAALRFEPDGAFGWLGAPLSTATDRRIDVRRMPRDRIGRLVQALAERVAPADALDHLQAQIAQAVRGTAPSPEVRHEVRRIEDDGPSPTRDAAARRRLQRLFLQRVGVAPRTLRSIVRFRRVFERLRQRDRWALAALAAGYFDQPQMARDFRRFLGCTATEWAGEQPGLAQLIASQPYKTAEAATA